MPNPDTFDHFVSALHRRAVVIRLIERVGICLATAAGVACVLTLTAEYRGVATGPIAPMLIATAVLVGAAWGLIRRPTRLEAVMQADEQLRLADLLSSAVLSSTDDFGQAVRAMATRACTTRSPSEVMLNRFGARAWGGVGLAWAMVLVLSLLAGNGSDSRAGETSNAAIGRSPTAANGASTTLANGRPVVGGKEASSDDFSHHGAPQDSQSAGTGHAAGSSGQSSNAAGGEHASQTHSTNADQTATPHGGAPGNANDSTAQLAVGNGAGSIGVTTPGRSGESTTARPADHAAAPWSSDHWPADRAAALNAVQDGSVPDAYRDLVRDYFSADH